MNRKVRNVLLGAAAAAVVVVAVVVPLNGARAEESTARGGVDIVLIRCATDTTNLALSGYQGSTRAPAQKSTSCSENISLVMREGFKIKDIGHYDFDKNYMLITLVK
jgi:hypothetical protein